MVITSKILLELALTSTGSKYWPARNFVAENLTGAHIRNIGYDLRAKRITNADVYEIYKFLDVNTFWKYPAWKRDFDKWVYPCLSKWYQYKDERYGGLPIGSPMPGEGENVVYGLYLAGDLVYLGSSGNFQVRVRNHLKEKIFDSWASRLFEDREEAFKYEGIVIRQHMPPLNKSIPKPITRKIA